MSVFCLCGPGACVVIRRFMLCVFDWLCVCPNASRQCIQCPLVLHHGNINALVLIHIHTQGGKLMCRFHESHCDLSKNISTHI